MLKTEINQASVSPARAQRQMGSQQSRGRARCRPGGTEEDGHRIPGEIQDIYLQADSEQSAEPNMGLHPTISRSRSERKPRVGHSRLSYPGAPEFD